MSLNIFEDKQFYKKLVVIAIPIIVQQLIGSSLNLVDNVMIGRLGETSIASVGLANQFYFIFMVVLFGINSGNSIFTSQYWGKKDVKNIRRVIGLNLFSSVAIGLGFTLVAIIWPKQILGLFSNDIEVIELGSRYLKITAFGYLFNAVSLVYGYSTRCIGQAKLPMYISAVSLGINTILNYALIFGKFGFPMLGVEGAALATLVARFIEMILLVAIIYYSKNVLAAKISELYDFSFQFMIKIFKTSIPVIINELFWVLGTTAYSAAYARINTEAIASVQIANTIQNIFFIISIGIGNASGVMIGNEIGKNNEHKVIEYTKKFFAIAIPFTALLGLIMYIAAPSFLQLYNVGDKVGADSITILRIFSAVLWLKTINMLIIVGMLRSGGDTKYAMYTEMGAVWLVGVPFAFIGALVLKLPVYIVVLMTLSEEVVKSIFGIKRIISRKWINNLVHDD
ncbi:MATE family efflux transporter [Clostridium sp. DL1XJH146]